MRHLLVRFSALALVVPVIVVVTAGAASAATITPVDLGSPFGYRYDVTMGAGVTTLTIEAFPGDTTKFVIREAGDTLSAPAVCTSGAGGAVVCPRSAVSYVTVTNSGGSTVPGTRDVVIARGSVHGDPESTWAPLVVNVASTGGLMEFWAGQPGGSFQGSDLDVGTAATPADIYHSGPGGGCATTCDLKAGADVLVGGSGADNVDGGPGNDVLSGGAGDDKLNGGSGDDLLLPGANQDASQGGPGLDTISYDDSARTTGLAGTVGGNGTIGSLPYDRTTFSGGNQDTVDSFSADIERFVGTPLGDNLIGSSGPDFIDGAGGDDTLTGSGGADTLIGGAGDETIDAVDGTVDTIDCGPGYATVSADPQDVVSNCVVKPPPAPPVPAPPVPASPTPAPGLPQPVPKASLKAKKLANGDTQVRSLIVEQLQAGDVLMIACKGGGCTRKALTTITARTTRVSVGGAVKGLLLSPGARITVKVVRAGSLLRTVIYSARRGRTPKVKEKSGAHVAFHRTLGATW